MIQAASAPASSSTRANKRFTAMLGRGRQHRQDAGEHEAHRHQPHAQLGTAMVAEVVGIDGGDDFVEAKAEADQGQTGADSGHQGALRRRPIAFLGQLVGEVHGCSDEA